MTAPYYQDDRVTLYHGDCREVTAWLAADVLVTDPPYGVEYSDRRGAKVTNDHDFTTAAAVLSMAGVMPMAVFANHASLPATLSVVRETHERTRVAVWHKTNVNGASGGGNPWMADVEFAVCGVPEWPKRPASGVISTRRFTGNPACNASPDAYLHPTQKSTGVMEGVIALMPTGVIADPFAGSGTTLVAARTLGRRAIGIELEERYCEVIAKRLAQDVLDFGEATA